MALVDLNEQTTRDMDMFAFRLMPDAEQERLHDFAQGRLATLIVSAERTMPEDLLEATSVVRDVAREKEAFADSVDTEEFALASAMTAYVMRRMPQ